MNLERVAAAAFLSELTKIANDTSDDGTKTAAMSLLNEMTLDEVAGFLKEAGLMAGLYQAGAGALKGGLSVASGAARGAVGAIKGVGQGIAGRVQQAGASALNAVKAAPGNLGNRLSSLGARMETAGAAKGTQLAQGGIAAGQAARGRLAGPGGTALQDISTSLKANKPAPAPSMGSALDRLDGMQGGAQTAPAGKLAPPAAAQGTPAPLRVPSAAPAPPAMPAGLGQGASQPPPSGVRLTAPASGGLPNAADYMADNPDAGSMSTPATRTDNAGRVLRPAAARYGAR